MSGRKDEPGAEAEQMRLRRQRLAEPRERPLLVDGHDEGHRPEQHAPEDAITTDPAGPVAGQAP